MFQRIFKEIRFRSIKEFRKVFRKIFGEIGRNFEVGKNVFKRHFLVELSPYHPFQENCANLEMA